MITWFVGDEQMITWFDDFEIKGETVLVEVQAEWENPDEELHDGYWDIVVIDRITCKDITAMVDRQQIRRLEVKANQLAEASWNDAAPEQQRITGSLDPAIDFAFDVFCDW